MIQKLKEQKRRLQILQYNDSSTLDDIIRKTKLYLEQLFPDKPRYGFEVDKINFDPFFTIDGIGKRSAWDQAQNSLNNLIDTRIEEYELLIEQKKFDELKKPQVSLGRPPVIEKIVEVENKDEINRLSNELIELKQTKNLWNKINYGTFIPIIFGLIAGAFGLGYYFGNNKFDQTKIDLTEDKKTLKMKVDSLNNVVEQIYTNEQDQSEMDTIK